MDIGKKNVNVEGLQAYDALATQIRTKDVTIQQLRTLCDSGRLVPGHTYKVTDYAFYVNPAFSGWLSSGEHPFDIIVTALNKYEISPVAFADRHLGDVYYEDCQLNLWELRVKWTMKSPSRVWTLEVTWMKDEWDNEACYDFKNALFKRVQCISAPTGFDLIKSTQSNPLPMAIINAGATDPEKGHYPCDATEQFGFTFGFDESTYEWLYTFSHVGSSIKDASVVAGSYCYNNVIGGHSLDGGRHANNIVMVSTGDGDFVFANNRFDAGCRDMTFAAAGLTVKDNHFGRECYGNVFVGGFSGDKKFTDNELGDYFSENYLQGRFEDNRTADSFMQNYVSGYVEFSDFGYSFFLNKIESIEESRFGSRFSYNEYIHFDDLTVGDVVQSCHFDGTMQQSIIEGFLDTVTVNASGGGSNVFIGAGLYDVSIATTSGINGGFHRYTNANDTTTPVSGQ